MTIQISNAPKLLDHEKKINMSIEPTCELVNDKARTEEHKQEQNRSEISQERPPEIPEWE